MPSQRSARKYAALEESGSSGGRECFTDVRRASAAESCQARYRIHVDGADDAFGHLVAGRVGCGGDALYLELELVHVARPPQRFFVGNEALLEQPEDGLVEGLHPVLRRARGDSALNQVRLFLVDDAVADERRGDQHFHGRYAPGAIGSRNKALRDHRLQYGGELQSHLLLLVWREDGDDTVDRFRGIQGV